MARIAIALIAAIGLLCTSHVVGQSPDVIEENVRGGYLGRLNVKSFGSAVGRVEQIAVWRIRERDPESGLVRFEQVRILKDWQRPAGSSPMSMEMALPAETIPSWLERGREAVVFIHDGKASACFGTSWHEMIFDAERNLWRADYQENLNLRRLFSGSTDDLTKHVRAILAGREVIVTAEKRDASRDAYRSVNANRIWRIKASLNLDEVPRTIRSPHFAGWSAGDRDDLPKMIARLTHPQWWMRSLAIRDIASLGDQAKDAVPELWKRFTDERPLIRIEAAEALLRIDATDGLPLLAIVLELRNPDRAIREEAVQVFSRWKRLAAPLLPWLLASFEREQAPFPIQTVVLLGELGANAKPELKREIAQVIARKIRAANSAVCVENTLSLLLTDLADQAEGDSRPPPMLNFRSDERDSLFHALAAQAILQLGRESAPAFPTLKLMVRAGTEGSNFAAQALLQFASDGPAWLAKQLTTKQPASKVDIIRALSEYPDEARIAIPALRRLLNDPDAQTRIATASALLWIDPETNGWHAARTLYQIANDKNSVSRLEAQYHVERHGLLQLKIATAEGRRYERYLLLKTLRNVDSPERSQALWRLEQMGAEASDAIPELWRLMEREKSEFQLELLSALATIDAPVERGKLARNSRPRLVEKLGEMFRDESHSDEALVRAAMRLGPSAAPLLQHIWCCLGHSSDDVRWCALRVMADIGPAARDAIPDLLRIADEDRPGLQEEAIIALCRISRGSPMAVQRLRDWCRTEDPTIIGRLWPDDLGNEKITPILLRIIEDDSPYVAADALALLRATDPEEAKKLEPRK